MSNKHSSHELLKVVAAAIVKKLVYIRINRVLVPLGDLGTLLLEDNHRAPRTAERNRLRPDVTKMRNHIGRNPRSKLLHVFIARLRIGRHSIHYCL